MSTISSFRAELLALASCLALVAGCAAQVSRVAPDAPRPAKQPAIEMRVAEVETSAFREPLRITSVRVRRVDAQLRTMAGANFLDKARDPVAIEVLTEKPLPKEIRDTSAILIVNGERYTDTWSILPNRLVAFLPDARTLKRVNTVAAVWLGSEEALQNAVEFRASDIEE